ncbi:MAG: hypothetical protein ACE5EX_05345 [Phycisphaerae bacterium]
MFDDRDLCPESTAAAMVLVNGRDTTVANVVFSDGCTMADLIYACKGAPHNHGGFVDCVTGLARQRKRERLITGVEHGRIVSCATTTAPCHTPPEKRSTSRSTGTAGRRP